MKCISFLRSSFILIYLRINFSPPPRKSSGQVDWMECQNDAKKKIGPRHFQKDQHSLVKWICPVILSQITCRYFSVIHSHFKIWWYFMSYRYHVINLIAEKWQLHRAWGRYRMGCGKRKEITATAELGHREIPRRRRRRSWALQTMFSCAWLYTIVSMYMIVCNYIHTYIYIYVCIGIPIEMDGSMYIYIYDHICIFPSLYSYR